MDKKQTLPVNLRDYNDPEGAGSQIAVFQERAGVSARGDYHATENTEPNSSAVVAHTRDAAVDKTHSVERVTSVGGDDDKKALDVAISDSQGNRIDEDNPMAVYMAESPADEVDDYQEDADVASDGSVNHDYVVSATKSLKSIEAPVRSSGSARFTLEVETAAASGVFNAVDTVFTSVADQSDVLSYKKKVATGVTVRVVKTNFENKANDLYSRITGLEI